MDIPWEGAPRDSHPGVHWSGASWRGVSDSGQARGCFFSGRDIGGLAPLPNILRGPCNTSSFLLPSVTSQINYLQPQALGYQVLGPNSPYHLFYIACSWAKNDSNIFKWLEKIKRFCDTWELYENQIPVSTKFYWNTTVPISLCIIYGGFCSTMQGWVMSQKLSGPQSLK